METTAGEALDGPVLVESLSPMIFPVGPCFWSVGTMVPFLPGFREVTALECMLDACGYHGLFGDGYPCVVGKILAIFLLADVDRE